MRCLHQKQAAWLCVQSAQCGAVEAVRAAASASPGGTERAVIVSVSVTSICRGTRHVHIAKPSFTGTFLLMTYSDHLGIRGNDYSLAGRLSSRFEACMLPDHAQKCKNRPNIRDGRPGLKGPSTTIALLFSHQEE